MTPAEEGAYIRLLAYQWQDKTGTLPDDPERLGAMSRLGRSYFEGASKVLRGTFEKVPGVEGRIYNKRLFDDWKREVEGRMRMAAGGIKSGEARRNKNRNVTKVLQGTIEGPSKDLGHTFDNLPDEKNRGIYIKSLKTTSKSKALLTREDLEVSSTNSCSNNPTPVSENNSELVSPAEEFGLTPDEPKPKRLSQAEWSERIYQAYPRKTAKKAALRAIMRCLKSEPPEALLEATEAYAEATSRWPAEKQQFIPYPASWFNAGHYADDRADWERNSHDPSAPKSIWDNIPPLTPEIDELIESAGRLVRGDV